MTATQNALNPKISVSAEWKGQHGKMYRSFRYWMTEGWSQSFLQVQVGATWVTLY